MEERIRYWLEANPEMRGHKEAVVSSIWWNELPDRLKTTEVQEVLEMINRKELSSAETIMRSMRKVLETRDAWRKTAKYEPPKKKDLGDVLNDLAKKT